MEQAWLTPLRFWAGISVITHIAICMLAMCVIGSLLIHYTRRQIVCTVAIGHDFCMPAPTNLK